MKTGLTWYKREPVAYLGGVQGLSAREHAVYAVVLDLIYVHGGDINDDPKWISGWFSDLGPAAVRNAIQSLCERGKIQKIDGKLTQNRAKTEVKQRKKQAFYGSLGGKQSAFLRAQSSENNDLNEESLEGSIQPEKRREDKEREAYASPKKVNGSKPHKPRRSPSRALPEGWAPDIDKARRLMSELDLNRSEMNYCYQRMREHAYANDRRQVDWDRAFNSWVRKAVNDGEVGPGAQSRKGRGSALDDI